MKFGLLFIFLALSKLAFAATPTVQQINLRAFDILLSKASQFKVDFEYTKENEEILFSSELASQLLTPANSQSQISNNCIYDKNDEVFKCTLSITHNGDEKSETSVMYKYELEKNKENLPSEELFLLTIFKQVAG